MSFDELIDIDPKINLATLIQLFLKGYDDKIYIDLYIGNDEGDPVLTNVRIIATELEEYYERDILCIGEAFYETGSLLSVVLK